MHKEQTQSTDTNSEWSSAVVDISLTNIQAPSESDCLLVGHIQTPLVVTQTKQHCNYACSKLQLCLVKSLRDSWGMALGCKYVPDSPQDQKQEVVLSLPCAFVALMADCPSNAQEWETVE